MCPNTLEDEALYERFATDRAEDNSWRPDAPTRSEAEADEQATRRAGS